MSLKQLRYLLKVKREELATMQVGTWEFNSTRKQFYYLYDKVKGAEKALTTYGCF